MDVDVRPASPEEVDAVARLYDDVTDHLDATNNYPRWKKGVYPTRDDACRAYEAGGLYVALRDGRLAGTMTLSHEPPEGFSLVTWSTPNDYSRTLMVYRLAVAPQHLGSGVGLALLEHAETVARAEADLALRLDTSADNEPACRLYARAGFSYAGTVSLGCEDFGLPWFRLFEKVL